VLDDLRDVGISAQSDSWLVLYPAMTNIQGIQVLQVDPAPPIVKQIGRSSELVGERRRKVIRMLDGMRQFLVSDVFTTAW
jgi:hypothetical protein